MRPKARIDLAVPALSVRFKYGHCFPLHDFLPAITLTSSHLPVINMSQTEKVGERVEGQPAQVSLSNSSVDVQLVNASGHVQELDRNFSLWSLAGLGIVVGSTWPAVGGSIVRLPWNPLFTALTDNLS